MTIPQDSESTWLWPLYSSHGTNENDATLANGKSANYGLWWIVLIVGYLIYYLMIVVAKPKVICGGKRLKDAIVEHCPIFFECYWPSPWAFNSHLMTILRARWQRCPEVHYERCVFRSLLIHIPLAITMTNLSKEDMLLFYY